MKKIGFLADYLNFRVDCIELINQLANQYEIVVFTNQNNKKHVPKNIEVRVIDYKMRNKRNRLWKTIAMVFVNIPKPSKYYFLKQRINFLNTPNKKLNDYIIYYARRIAPKIISFDFYLKNLKEERLFPISDIDTFIIMTPHEQDLFLSEISKTNKPIFAYLHSWDHVFKFQKISQKRFSYLTWNEDLRNDLNKGFQIPKKSIKIVGSSQIALLKHVDETLTPSTVQHKGQYFYFVASFGHKDAVIQEVKIIEHFCSELSKISEYTKVIFRPYPNLKNQELYKPLRDIPNLEFDNYIPNHNNKLLSLEDIRSKLSKFYSAVAVVHVGTTVATEAAHFDIPVIYINFNLNTAKSQKVQLDEYWKQYHLQEYYFTNEYWNVLTSPNEVKNICTQIIKDRTSFLPYSKKIKEKTKIVKYPDIVRNIGSAIESSYIN